MGRRLPMPVVANSYHLEDQPFELELHLTPNNGPAGVYGFGPHPQLGFQRTNISVIDGYFDNYLPNSRRVVHMDFGVDRAYSLVLIASIRTVLCS